MSKRRSWKIYGNVAVEEGSNTQILFTEPTAISVELRPDERVFSRDEIYSIIGKARNENIKTYEIINELFREGE